MPIADRANSEQARPDPAEPQGAGEHPVRNNRKKQSRAMPPEYLMLDGVEYPPPLVMFFELAIRRAATRQRMHETCPRARCRRRKSCELRLDFFSGEAVGDSCSITDRTIDRAVEYVNFFRSLINSNLFGRAYARLERPEPPPDPLMLEVQRDVWCATSIDRYEAKLRGEARAEAAAARAVELAEEAELARQRAAGEAP